MTHNDDGLVGNLLQWAKDFRNHAPLGPNNSPVVETLLRAAAARIVELEAQVAKARDALAR